MSDLEKGMGCGSSTLVRPITFALGGSTDDFS